VAFLLPFAPAMAFAKEGVHRRTARRGVAHPHFGSLAPASW
jgi:hypothetical protein